MLRTALRPANLGLLAIMVAAAVVFSLLGQWQLGRSQEHARVSPTETAVPLDDVLQPASDFTGHADRQRVSAAGTWAAVPLEVVDGREVDGRSGRWVVAALTVDATGGLLPVVLGWQPDGAALPAAPSGGADLLGRMQVSEGPQGLDDDGGLRALSSADLVNVWPGRLYTGYLVADAGAVPETATGAAGGGGAELVAAPSPAPTRQLDLQNLSYAFQWWLFAAFALVLWGKVVRDRHTDELADARADEDAAAARDGAVSPTWEDASVPDAPAAPGVLTPDDAPPVRGARS